MYTYNNLYLVKDAMFNMSRAWDKEKKSASLTGIQPLTTPNNSRVLYRIY